MKLTQLFVVLIALTSGKAFAGNVCYPLSNSSGAGVASQLCIDSSGQASVVSQGAETRVIGLKVTSTWVMGDGRVSAGDVQTWTGKDGVFSISVEVFQGSYVLNASVKSLATGTTLTYKPQRNVPARSNGCNGRGRCI